MEQYLFKLDKGLFELQAMEMDDALYAFFQDRNLSENKFEMENEMKRKFNQDFVRADAPEFKRKGEAAWGHYQKVIALAVDPPP